MVAGADQGTVGILEDLHRGSTALYALSNWSVEKDPAIPFGRAAAPGFDQAWHILKNLSA
jgi:hypothetical protein